MMEELNTIQRIFIVTRLNWFLGSYDRLLSALLAFVITDYVIAVMCAVVDHRLSGKIGLKGICCKVLIFLLVGMANILDVQVVGTGNVLRTAVIFFYIYHQGMSILNNAEHLELPLPEKMKDFLEQLHTHS